MKSGIRRSLTVAAVGVVVAGGGFGYMAANAVNPSSAGEGSGAVSGYNVSNIDYVPVSPANAKIDLVTFHLNPQNGVNQRPGNELNVQAAYNNTDNWVTCGYDGAPGSGTTTKWFCDFPNFDAADITSLQVMAAE